jgi:hypothetical protein
VSGYGRDGRFGRRNNGIYAAEYAVAGDVDPRVGEHLLDVLGNRGIAAYLQPAADQHPITRLTTLPSRPTDRLYVDRAELNTARKFLDMVSEAGDSPSTVSGEPAAAGPGFDVAWALIVAEFDRGAVVADGMPPWPASEEVEDRGASSGEVERRRPRPDSGPRPLPDDGSGETDRPRVSSEASLLDGLDRFGADLPDEDEEDYEPPAPPPFPRVRAITIVAVVAVLVGFTLIIDPDLLPGDIGRGDGSVIGGMCLVVGAALLIGRLRSGNDDDPDDSDGGAIV